MLSLKFSEENCAQTPFTLGRQNERKNEPQATLEEGIFAFPFCLTATPPVGWHLRGRVKNFLSTLISAVSFSSVLLSSYQFTLYPA